MNDLWWRLGLVAAVVAVAVLAVLAIAAGTVALVARGGGDDDATPAPSTETPTTTGATTPSTEPRPNASAPGSTAPGAKPIPPSGNPEIDRFLPDAIGFVERTRGLAFKQAPHVVALDGDAFVARFQELIAKDAEKNAKSYDDTTSALQALGLLRSGQTFLDAQNALGAGGVLGYYDPETKELRVRAGRFTALARITIVHELVHALEDQHFNLNRPQYDDADDEIGFGFSALAEGSARRVENAYRDSLTAEERRSATLEESTFGSLGALAKLTLGFLQLQIAPYEYGELFVDELFAQGGQAALDRAFSAVPATSEQVITPAKYFAREGRTEVAKPSADGAVFDEGVLGQLVLLTLMSGSNSAAVAQAAADGWAGDWYVAWREGARSCLRARVAMDSESDAGELANALRRYATTRPAGRVTGAGTNVEMTVCG